MTDRVVVFDLIGTLFSLDAEHVGALGRSTSNKMLKMDRAVFLEIRGVSPGRWPR